MNSQVCSLPPIASYYIDQGVDFFGRYAQISPLLLLRQDDTWRAPSELERMDYDSVYRCVFELLVANRGKGKTAALQPKSFVFANDHLNLCVLRVESHRACTVVFALQDNSNTGGIRLLAFGIRHNEDNDRGIGRCLGSFTTQSVWESCAHEIGDLKIAKFLE